MPFRATILLKVAQLLILVLLATNPTLSALDKAVSVTPLFRMN